MDDRKEKTLAEQCANGDGTYNGVRLLSLLSGVSEDEVRRAWEAEKEKRRGR